MPRSQNPRSLHDDPEHLHARISTGVLSFLNPTRVYYKPSSSAPQSASQDLSSSHSDLEKESQSSVGLPVNAHYLWRSRDNRKGRHAIVVDASSSSSKDLPPMTSSFKEVSAGLRRMGTQANYWDVSWLVAVVFTLGSMVWCVNGFFAFLPLVRPSTEFSTEATAGVGWTAWLGATIFELGSIFLMMEALNESRSACFGWAIEQQLGNRAGAARLVPDENGCLHRHKKGARKDSSTPSWVWWPTWQDFRVRYARQIGFWACSWQMFGATVFWISGFTSIPNVIDLDNTHLANGVYWTPQVVGGSGFIISSLLFMLETQKFWYLPAPFTLGWHVGFWNLIGALGFTLCGIFGYFPNDSGCVYQSSLSTFWGSFAFLLGSLAQWYEAVDKHPVETQRLHPDLNS